MAFQRYSLHRGLRIVSSTSPFHDHDSLTRHLIIVLELINLAVCENDLSYKIYRASNAFKSSLPRCNMAAAPLGCVRPADPHVNLFPGPTTTHESRSANRIVPLPGNDVWNGDWIKKGFEAIDVGNLTILVCTCGEILARNWLRSFGR